jgi:NADPH2:quinone reductase
MIAEAMQALSGWLVDGKLRIILGGTYPLEEAARAQQDLEARRTHGKLALLVAQGEPAS